MKSNPLKKIRDLCYLIPVIFSSKYTYYSLLSLIERKLSLMQKEWKHSRHESKELILKQLNEAQNIISRLRSDSYVEYITATSLSDSEMYDRAEQLKQEDKQRLSVIFTEQLFNWR